MTDRTEIRQSLINSLRELTPHVVVRDDDGKRDLQELGLDSLDVNGLLLSIQETYDILVSDEELQTLVCLDDYVEFIAARNERGR